MSSAPSVPGIEVGAPWLGGCEHVLTAGTLELLATLHRTFGPRRTELPESRAVRDAELAGGRCPDSWPGTKDMRQGDWQVAPLAPGLVDRRVEITGPDDRKMVVNALKCDAKVFMADYGVGHDEKLTMPAQFRPEDLDTMQLGCCALGPDNLANPGMVVPTPRPCGEGPGPRTAAGDTRDPAIGQVFFMPVLALDPPEQGATLGGLVSANTSGARRLRHGTAGDPLIGVADGTTARAGGELVTNLAGYHLGRLCTGARGSPGVPVSTAWRPHPLPPARGAVVVPVAGAAEIKEYGHQLRVEPDRTGRGEALAAKVRDVTELLDDLSPLAPRTPLRVSIAYRNTCHLAHAQGVRDQPGRLLHNLLHPEPARELAERKTRAVLATGAPPMVTADPGCWMQVARRWRGRASRCPSRTSCRCSTHRSKPCRSDATSLTRWTAPARRSGTAPGRRFDPLAPFRKEYGYARRLPAGL
jgi:Malate synthase